MTGHGDAQNEFDGLRVSVDIRSVNSRYFKFATHGAETGGDLDAKIEAVVKKQIRRGSVTLRLQLSRKLESEYRINRDVLQGYFKQLSRLDTDLNLTASGSVSLDTMLTLPGVIGSNGAADDSDETWKIIEATISQAIGRLQRMRQVEGQAMVDDMTENVTVIANHLDQIESRAPEVVVAYQTRLTDRINALLEKHDVAVSPSDVVREVGVFAERADVSEECVRLRSHLDQFRSIIDQTDAAGKKLDFVVQEMFRETNTIGSKASDATISKHVVEIKSSIERIREMVQNIE